MDYVEEELLEPLKYFSELKYRHEENVNSYFDELAQKAGTDINANRLTCDEYYSFKHIAEMFQKKVDKNKGFRVFFIILTILFIIAGIVFIALVFSYKDKMGVFIPSSIGCFLVAAGLIVLTVKVFSKAVKKYKLKVDENNAKANEKKKVAEEQMATLNALYDWNMTSSLITKTAPILKMDKTFTVERCAHLAENYGWKMGNPDNVSTVFAQSGTIIGNPFIYERDYVQTMYDKTYTGTLVIHWTTISTDSKGNPRTVHHTQTLTATVVKPAARFFLDTALIYGNEAAPKLSFSRTKSAANSLSETKIEKNAVAFEKKLTKKQEKNINSGFTALTNSKFEYLFNALDRDNEVEFRLLFTPLAQKNMISLITSKSPYGDDFRFVKRKMINLIHSDHAQTLDFDGNPVHFRDFDFERARKNFYNYNMNAFQGIYYDFAPLLSIPLYQQQRDYDPKLFKDYKGTITEYEAEVMVNNMSIDLFRPEDCDTNIVLKAKLLQCNNGINVFEITSHGFHLEPHVELVPKLGGDGNMHAVPVTWYEYIPVEGKGTIAVFEVGGTNRDFYLFEDKLKQLISTYGISSDIIYQRGLLSFPLKEGITSFNTNEINKFFSHEEE